jgi:hypothetical protein
MPNPLLLLRALTWWSDMVGLMMVAAVRAAVNSILPPRDFSCMYVRR